MRVSLKVKSINRKERKVPIVMYFFTIHVTVLYISFFINLPPSQPPLLRGRLSPKGEGAGFAFPPWGKLKGGVYLSNFVTKIPKYYIAIGIAEYAKK